MDIFKLLKRDHEELLELLNELVAINPEDDYRFIVIEQIRNLLIPHLRAEESVLYNTLRAVDAQGSYLRNYKEHLEAEGLLRALQVMDRFNFEWKGSAQKLKAALENHIQEEETVVFSEAKNIFTTEESLSMGQAFKSLKSEIEKEGFLKSSLDLVVNMLPPRLGDKLRSFEKDESRHL